MGSEVRHTVKLEVTNKECTALIIMVEDILWELKKAGKESTKEFIRVSNLQSKLKDGLIPRR